jgi:hypothetical protein
MKKVSLIILILGILSGCSLKHHIVSSSTSIDTSKSAFHFVDRSLLVDSSKYTKSKEKTVFIDTSKALTTDDYERTIKKYFSINPVTNLPVLDSAITTQKGKKATQKNNQKNTTTTKKEEKADLNTYAAKKKEVDSNSQKGIAQTAKKKGDTDFGTPFGTYLLVFAAIVIMCALAWLAKKYIIK